VSSADVARTGGACARRLHRPAHVRRHTAPNSLGRSCLSARSHVRPPVPPAARSAPTCLVAIHPSPLSQPQADPPQKQTSRNSSTLHRYYGTGARGAARARSYTSCTAAMPGIFSRSFCVTATRTCMRRRGAARRGVGAQQGGGRGVGGVAGAPRSRRARGRRALGSCTQETARGQARRLAAPARGTPPTEGPTTDTCGGPPPPRQGRRSPPTPPRTVMTLAAGPVMRTFTMGPSMPTISRPPPPVPTR
jgi:hypothetical protein